LVAFFLPPTGGVAVNLPGEIDGRVLALSIGITLLSTLLFSLIPAIQNSNIDLASALKSESGAVFGSRGKSRLRSGLVLLQMALSFVLLVGSVLLIESVHKIRTADPGFSTQNVLTSTVNLISAGYDEQRAKTFREGLVDRLQAIAGVESAAYSRIRPFTYSPYPSARIAVDGYQPRSNEVPSVEYNQVDPRYLETMGIALLSGRDFTRADDENSLPVAVVNEKMVEQYWRGQDPVGKRLQVDGRWLRVIGVAKLSKYGALGEAPRPFFYTPMRQGLGNRSGIINIRTSLDAGLMAAALARVVHELDANLAPTEVITMREQVNRYSLRSQQIAVTLLGIFGGLAVLLAAIGLYGVMSHTVNQSTRELGLRIALGASARDLLQLVFTQGFFLTAAGVVIGSAAALLLTRLIGALLYQINPRDPIAFASAFAVLTITSISAVLLPARRATKTDPASVLRE
jgi:predicted permease